MESPLVVEDQNSATMRKKMKQYKFIIILTFSAFIASLALFICAMLLKLGCSLKTEKNEINVQKTYLKFLHLSDTHIDFNYNSTINKQTHCRSIQNKLNITPAEANFIAPYGRVECDPPAELLGETLKFSKELTDKADNDIDFILLTGDLVAHDIDSDKVPDSLLNRVLHSINHTSLAIAKKFPKKGFLPLLGNHDLPMDNILPKNKTFYQSILKIWKPLILCSHCTTAANEKELENSFLSGGYYSAEINGHNVLMLQLNSNYWSVSSLPKNPSSSIYVTADKQMEWLEKQLIACLKTGKKAIIAGHVPPGIDGDHKSLLWAQNYTNKYVQLVAKTYREVVIGQFFAHTHKDDMKLLTYEKSKDDASNYSSWLLLAPPITPLLGNNPAFRIVQIDMDYKLVADYDQYYLDLVLSTQRKAPVWLHDYSFSTTYLNGASLKRKGINAENLGDIIAKMVDPKDKNQVWQNYIQHRTVNYQPNAYSRYALYCAMKNAFKSNYDDCMKSHPVTGG